MAFYFALLNVSKKEQHRGGGGVFANSSAASRRHHYHHRRHSIASVESPHTNCRELPRPQLLHDEHDDDLVIGNNLALDARRSRASQWLHDNHNNINSDQHQPLSRSRRIAHFPVSNSAGEIQTRGGGKKSSQRKTAAPENRRPPSRLPVRKKDAGESNAVRPICRIHVERALNITRQISSIPTNAAATGSATDDSRRSSQMSNATASPQREPSPVSSAAGDEPCTSRIVAPSMKLSGISISSRNSEPRLKKVTFETSPYVISNTFLGDRAVLVRRGSGTAVRRLLISSDEPSLPPTPKVLAPHDEVFGDDWWTPFGDLPTADNRANEALERLQSRHTLRRLIRRRSTSDQSRLLAYRNTGFLSSSQERKPAAKMTASVDRPKYT